MKIVNECPNRQLRRRFTNFNDLNEKTIQTENLDEICDFRTT